MSTTLHPTPVGIIQRGPGPDTVTAQQPRSVARTLLAALELGVLGNFLLRAGDVGVNITLWCWAVLAAGVLATPDVTTDRRRVALLVATGFFAAVPAWRADPALVLFSGLAVLVLLVLLAWTTGVPGIALAARTIGSYIGAAWTAFLHILAGALPMLASEARVRVQAGDAYRQPAGAVLRGLVLAVPVLLVFGALLMEADAAYASLMRGLFRWDLATLGSHVALTAVFTWLAAAYLTASTEWTRVAPAAAPGFRIGAIEAGTVLALVDTLFLSFVVVQARYLFGGVAHVLETTGLSYADYARRGFFELVAVSALALPLLVLVTSGARIETPSEKRIHRVLALTLVGLLMLMMASALSRMWLYQAQYGWTLSRVHATTLMLWIGGSIAWFAVTALRGAPQRFMIGSIGGGLALLAALAIANPAAAVVRANARRAMEGKSFDVVHAVGLGADGMPALLAVLPDLAPRLSELDRCALRLGIDRAHAGWLERRKGLDWRTYSVADARLRTAVDRYGAAAGALLPPAASCVKGG